jgi:hypothetical protein
MILINIYSAVELNGHGFFLLFLLHTEIGPGYDEL